MSDELIIRVLTSLSPVLMVLALLALGYITGHLVEAKHHRSLTSREALPGPSMTTLSHLPANAVVTRSTFCTGSTVVASDYFKTFAATLKGLVGGRLKTLETLLDRGRREALLRMREQAIQQGADMILCVRLETSMIMKKAGKSGAPAVEIIAYGTAVKLKNGHGG